MKQKPTGARVAAAAMALLGTPYANLDCQALVRRAVSDAGGERPPKGVNTLMRSDSILWWGTLENARAQGMLVPGAALLIHADDGREPARYRGDGMGNFHHIGLYVGDGALTDNGRACSVIHSSQTRGRVAGSTLQNGWTHLAWLGEIDYGRDIRPGVTLGEAAWPAEPCETLRRGSRGEAVRELQTRLTLRGYDIGPSGADGIFGPATRAAVMAFQRARGLEADGIAGRLTWAALRRTSDEEEVLE